MKHETIIDGAAVREWFRLTGNRAHGLQIDVRCDGRLDVRAYDANGYLLDNERGELTPEADEIGLAVALARVMQRVGGPR